MIISPIINGYRSTDVVVECSMTNGLPGLLIVGLASKSVDEAKERLRSAITSAGFKFPRKRIVINLAPADVPKNSSSLDLAMAISILLADGQIRLTKQTRSIVCIGELSLKGDIRPVKGLIGLIKDLPDNSTIILPIDNRAQAGSFISKYRIFAIRNLREAVELMNGVSPEKHRLISLEENRNLQSSRSIDILDFSEIIGQELAKRAMVIAAAGGHNILLSGPPGTGKSMLAKAFVGILPALSEEESLDTTHLHSIAGHEISNLVIYPPLRSPHHTASNIAIVGGGHHLKPGEISLAHNGVLFLDELPEFQKTTLESLRQPLEDNQVTIARAQSSATFPAKFILVATSNPCPCGYYGTTKTCSCSAQEINRYQKKLSGPILDRIDIHISVNDINHKNLLSSSKGNESPLLKEKVRDCRKRQLDLRGDINSKLSNAKIKKYADMTEETKDFLDLAAARMGISARAYFKILKIARTIADLDNEKSINKDHIAEAIQFRPKHAENL